MHRFESIDLGHYRGANYQLVGFVSPDPTPRDRYDPAEDADDYGVTVARSSADPTESHVEIVRMDTSNGRPHLDRCYRSAGARKQWLPREYSYDRMKRYLLANWRQFVDRARAARSG